MEGMYYDIHEKVIDLMWLIRQQRFSRGTKFGPFADSSYGQGRILAMLKLHDDIPMNELSYLLGIRQQTLNEQVKKLEKAGFVERKQSEDDKRVSIVHITEKGRDVKQSAPEYETILSCFNEEELKQLDDYLGRIIDKLKEELGDNADFKDRAQMFMGEGEDMDPKSMRKMMMLRRKMMRGKFPIGAND